MKQLVATTRMTWTAPSGGRIIRADWLVVRSYEIRSHSSSTGETMAAMPRTRSNYCTDEENCSLSLNLTSVGTSRCDVPAREAADSIVAPLNAVGTAQRAIPTRVRGSMCEV